MVNAMKDTPLHVSVEQIHEWSRVKRCRGFLYKIGWLPLEVDEVARVYVKQGIGKAVTFFSEMNPQMNETSLRADLVLWATRERDLGMT